MKSIYIAGAYTADTREGEDVNIYEAAKVAMYYIHQGWSVFCPHTMTSIIDREFNQNKEVTWEKWMEIDIYWLVKCDAIHMVSGWQNSKGACMEHTIAKALGKEIYY